MGEGRAVEGRKASPSVCLATPLLADSLKAFLTKNSFRVIAFLPGSAQNIENDVTSTKQTVGEFLPGARSGQCRGQFSIAKPLSNRELELLEPRLTHRKQTTAPRSNRELSTNRCRANSHAVIPILTFLTGLPRAFFANSSVCAARFLPGSGLRVEFAVTHSK